MVPLGTAPLTVGGGEHGKAGGTVGMASRRRWMAWWTRRSDTARIELYTRWTFHFFALCEALVFSLPGLLVTLPVWARIALTGSVAAHALLVSRATDRALDWALERRGRPTRLLAGQAALGGALAVAVGVLHAVGRTPEFSVTLTLCSAVLTFSVLPLVVNLRPAARVTGVACAVGAVAFVLGLLATDHLVQAVSLGGYTLFFAALLVFTGRFSAWLLAVVLELEAARETQTRLAVAEERLRFGRDLHDVLGRNLSVIALKSELAAQLAQRGAASAVDQMAEVQRIARESQREMRDVVRGYREASLDAELAGARGVLEAAGIACRIEAGGERGLPQAVQAALGWVVREGTTNVLRHADARTCTITVRTRDAVVLTMENDGVRRRAGAAGAGTGLAGLRERLAPLGGTLTAEAPECGPFRLTARLPTEPGPDAAPGPGDAGAGPAGGAAGDGRSRGDGPAAEGEVRT
ncbi:MULTISPECIES: sensor histidine kinase [Streptomyces]|uniref:sensor histidine kinase n=1 Tax=Streptomyces TaxID=1883 RepID=UPI00224900A6|nr:histidine kinase [Streptomyces sp. JHD 1]MCX2970555.1 histidine kinase [Streptomyces sp. JHD 1]